MSGILNKCRLQKTIIVMSERILHICRIKTCDKITQNTGGKKQLTCSKVFYCLGSSKSTNIDSS